MLSSPPDDELLLVFPPEFVVQVPVEAFHSYPVMQEQALYLPPQEIPLPERIWVSVE